VGIITLVLAKDKIKFGYLSGSTMIDGICEEWWKNWVWWLYVRDESKTKL